jgi:formylmethanofuran dehydrogenase subunit A
MAEYIIYVGQIEELQMLNDRKALDAIFRKAHSTVVGGEVVALVRETAKGQSYRFEEITTQEDLNEYKKNVYKYVKED